jgi:hypothetical protein
MKILEIKHAATLGTTIKTNWYYVINVIRAQAKTANVQQYMFSKIWYLAQTLLPLTKHVQQITSVCTWYIWRGAPFKVPVTTFRRPKDQGGWAMTDIMANAGLYSSAAYGP